MRHIPTSPYPELPWVLDKLVAGVQAVLAKNLLGVYLVGSLATGDFDHDSDIDFLVVTHHDLDPAIIPTLQAMHTCLWHLGCYPAQHLEGSYINLDLLNDPDRVGIQPVWYLDNGSTTFEQSTHDQQWHVRWILRECGLTLSGPPPTTLMAPIPVEQLCAEVIATLRRVVAEYTEALDQPLTFYTSRFGQSFVVLSACRILQTLEQGTVQSKLAGIQWASQVLDAPWGPLIQQAWIEREGVRFGEKVQQRAAPADLEESRRFLAYALAEGERRFAARTNR